MPSHDIRTYDLVIQVNKPTAGARTVKELQVGSHPFQLYSLATPNGQKVTVALEEMGLSYDAWHINIMEVCDVFLVRCVRRQLAREDEEEGVWGGG